MLRVDAFYRYEQQVALVISKQIEGPWLLFGMYASTEHREQRVLWSKLCRVISLGLPSLVVGDFNCISGPRRR